jgi:hypothetical protein
MQNKPIRYILFKEYKSLSIHTSDLYLSHGNLDIRRLYVYETILLIHKVRHGLIKYNLVLETNRQTHSYGTRRRDDFLTTQARNFYGVHCIVFSGLCMYNAKKYRTIFNHLGLFMFIGSSIADTQHIFLYNFNFRSFNKNKKPFY